MSSFSHLSNEELRQELNKNGIAYGPILDNTRKVYEKKLQNMLKGKVDGNVQNGVEENVTTNGNGTMNGNARTPSREASPLELTPQQQSREATPAGRMRETTPQATNNEEDSDDEEDASENARVLTPEEMHSFHSGLMRRYSESPSTNLRQRREKSSVQPMNGVNNGHGHGIATNSTNKSSAGSNNFKRYVMPILVIFVLVSMIAGAYYFRDQIPAMMKALPDVFNRQPQQKKMPMLPTTKTTMQE